LKREGQPIKKLSLVKTIRVFVQMVQMVTILAIPVFSLKEAICVVLIADESHCTTNKKSRNYPRKKRHRRCGKPKIIKANTLQKRMVAQL